MERTGRIVRSSMTTAVDVALAFVGIVAIVFPITALADAVLGSPLESGVLVVSAIAGLVGAYPFVVEDWSLGRLAKFVGVTFASSFGWLVLVAGAMQLAGVAIPAGDRRPFLFAGLLAFATAYVGVYSEHVDVDIENESASSFGAS